MLAFTEVALCRIQRRLQRPLSKAHTRLAMLLLLVLQQQAFQL